MRNTHRRSFKANNVRNLLNLILCLGAGNGSPLQYSCLENPMDRGAWWVMVHGVTRVAHDLVTKHQYSVYLLINYTVSIYWSLCIYVQRDGMFLSLNVIRKWGGNEGVVSMQGIGFLQVRTSPKTPSTNRRCSHRICPHQGLGRPASRTVRQ